MAQNEKYRPSFSPTAHGQLKVYSPTSASLSVWNIVFLPVPWSLVVSPVRRPNKSCLHWTPASERSFIFLNIGLMGFGRDIWGIITKQILQHLTYAAWGQAAHTLPVIEKAHLQICTKRLEMMVRAETKLTLFPSAWQRFCQSWYEHLWGQLNSL